MEAEPVPRVVEADRPRCEIATQRDVGVQTCTPGRPILTFAPTTADTTHPLPRGTCRELMISQQDVILYRAYLSRTDTRFDRRRYDRDAHFRTRLLYPMSPLVVLQRCPNMDRMLERRENTSLDRFASRLGLERTSESAPPQLLPRLRPRSRAPIAALPAAGPHSRTRSSRAAVPASVFSPPRPHLRSPEAAAPAPTLPPPRARRFRIRSERAAAAVSLRRLTEELERSGGSSPSKEYTILEDHAIVAWIASGEEEEERGQRVNGNRVWQQLEPLFPALTGRARTWHSLRNRYLRHLLPAERRLLERLALPPRLQRQLRAAATARRRRRAARVPPAPRPATPSSRSASPPARPLPARSSAPAAD